MSGFEVNLEGVGALERPETTQLETFSVENKEYLRSIEGLKPGIWSEMTQNERLNALRTLESRLAEIQGRPPLPVVAEAMREGEAGFFDGKALHVNIEHLKNPAYRLEVIDTIAHEGRHAYQYYAVRHPGFHPNTQEVIYWAANEHAYFHPKQIGEKFGPEYYLCQPTELDAWRYGAMTQDVFAELPSESPFAKFNAQLETAFAKVENNVQHPSLLERAGDLWSRIISGLDSFISPSMQRNILRAGVMALAHHRF